MKALVAAGGIAGLATGIGLRQAGFDVEIFEQAPELREISAGLVIWPNGARSLEALGVEADGCPSRRFRVIGVDVGQFEIAGQRPMAVL